jgi:hypothetical protein
MPLDDLWAPIVQLFLSRIAVCTLQALSVLIARIETGWPQVLGNSQCRSIGTVPSGNSVCCSHPLL